MNKQNTLIILRGLPGAGKTTIINALEKQLNLTAVICSADHYFYGNKEHKPENYVFDVDKLGIAHKICMDKATKALEDNIPLVMIDNTNIKPRDYKFYIRLGKEAGYSVIVHSIVGQTAEQSYNKNVHKVPFASCERMANAYKPVLEELEVQEVLHDFRDIRDNILGTGRWSK